MSTLRRLLMAHNMNQIRYPANATVWELTIPEGGASYQFFTRNRSNSSVVDWGDGSVETLSATGDKRIAHAYPAGNYTVSLTGAYDLLAMGDSNATYGKLVTGLLQVSEELTSWANLCKYCAITELPAGFTVPYGITDVVSMLEFCKIPYLPDGFSLPETVTKSSRMFYGGGLKAIPRSFVLPRSVQTSDMMFWAIGTLSFDIEWFLQKITAGCALTNLEGAFGNTVITGTAPIERLSSLSTITKYSNCFLLCRDLDNFAEIPPSWGGGKVTLENQTIETGTDVNITIAKVYENYGHHGGYYGTKFASANLPSGLSLVFNMSSHPNSCELKGTLAAGTYTFDVTLSNTWSSATATITLIVS